MATSPQRRLQPTKIRRFGSGRGQQDLPDLTAIQTESYASFLQDDMPADRSKVTTSR